MNQVTSISDLNDDLRPEYDLHELFQHGVRGKYADHFQAGVHLVPLDPDVAQAFPTAEAVNPALRTLEMLPSPTWR